MLFQECTRLVNELVQMGLGPDIIASPFLGRVVLVAGILGLLTTWNAIFLAASRVVFALGRARLIPPVFGRVHARFESPSACLSARAWSCS